MALAHKHVAALAVFVVLVAVGSGFVATGNVVQISSPTSHSLNLYVNSLDFPSKFSDTYVASATVTNTGRQSVTFVGYELVIVRPDGTGRHATTGFVNIGAGETKTFQLSALTNTAPGTHNAVFSLDTEDDYVETDESDNTYRATFATSY